MSEAMVRGALETLVAPFDDPEGDWADALRRGGVVGEVRRARRRRVVAFVLAASLAAVLAAAALGHDVVGRTLDNLAAWVGATPGDEAPADEQRQFDAQNAQALTHFPPGTKVGLLVRGEYDGRTYDLLGFRDGSSLCLRLVRAGGSTSVPATCAPQQQLTDLGWAAAVVDGQHPLPLHDPVATAVYGIAADDVRSVEIETAESGRHRATLARNAFLYVGPAVPFKGIEHRGDVATRAIVRFVDGATTSIPIRTFPATTAPPEPEELPGPATPAYTLRDSRIRWLEHGEPRGEPFDWPGTEPRLDHARLLRPNPDSSFQVAVGYAKAADGTENGNWYCLAWLWPLAERSSSYGCERDRLSDVTIASASFGGDQFRLQVGFAADAVARLELFFANGARENVPITDNVYAISVPQGIAVKLVAYDAADRVVGVHVLSG